MILVLNDGKSIEYEIERKNIKNINIRIKREGVFLSVPRRIKDVEIEKILREKQNWIIKNIEECKKKEVRKDIEEIDLNSNEDYYYFGEKCKIKIERRIFNEIEYKSDDKQLCVYTNYEMEKQVKKMIILWEKEKIKEELKKGLIKYNDLLEYLEIKELNITIKNMKSCWGVCTPKKNKISINKSLIHYPKECIEYILVHELCHIKHQNHSSDFYNLVKRYIPNYKKVTNELKGYYKEEI